MCDSGTFQGGGLDLDLNAVFLPEASRSLIPYSHLRIPADRRKGLHASVIELSIRLSNWGCVVLRRVSKIDAVVIRPYGGSDHVPR